MLHIITQILKKSTLKSGNFWQVPVTFRYSVALNPNLYYAYIIPRNLKKSTLKSGNFWQVPVTVWYSVALNPNLYYGYSISDLPEKSKRKKCEYLRLTGRKFCAGAHKLACYLLGPTTFFSCRLCVPVSWTAQLRAVWIARARVASTTW